MYSSLHKIDIVAEVGGAPLCVQTDHRDRAEIEGQRELSVVFGVARMLGPGLHDPDHRRVQYVCMDEAPDFLRELVRLCGATLAERGEKDPREPAQPADLEAVARIAHDALMALGRDVLARRGLDATQAALQALEAELRDGGDLDLEENEIGYYEALVELAAAGGVVIAARHEGVRWRITERPMAVVPLALDVGGGQLANLFGRTERFFEGEVDAGPAALVDFDLGAGARADAPVVGVLKPAAWMQGQPYPILSEPLVGGDDLPIIAYAHDHPSSVAYINPDTSGMTLEQARVEAQVFYRHVEVQVQRLGDDLPLWLVTGDYYAPEKLLDREFARELHARLEAETLIVGMPARGVAAVAPVHDDPRHATALMATFLQRAQQDSAPADRISAVPFLMLGGQISGYVKLDRGDDDAPEPPRKKGFWKRLFGG